MGMIFINRDRQSLGQFTPQEVADGLKSGKFLSTDLAWQDPMESWQPLSTFPGLPEATATVVASSESPVEDAPTGVIEPAWERENGALSSAIPTIREVLTRPVEVFRALPVEGGYGVPLKFYTLVGWATGVVAMLYQGAAAMINPSMMLGEHAKDISKPALVGILFGVMIIMPLFLIIGSFVSSGLMHLALMIVGGAKKPYQATYRAVAYASAAASVIQVIPICGGYLYSIASLIYCVIALKEVHRTEIWRPVLAVLILFLLCCGAIFGIVMLSVSLAGAVAGAK